MSWPIINECNSWQEFLSAMEPLRPDERGKAFELLTEFFLQIDPTYQTKLKNVWHEGSLPPEVRNKLDLPSTDLGVDLVAETHHGEFWAIQCKYHNDPKKNLRKTELDSFLNLTRQHCRGKFSTLLAVTSAHGYSHNITKIAPEVQFILSDEFQSLEVEFFNEVRAFVQGKTKRPDKRKPRPHQKAAIENAVKHFKEEGERRGKLVHPCGTGKSLIGFWISEALEATTTLVALPSLYLVRQTLNDWTKESLALGNTIDWRVVCSESTIGENDKTDPNMRFQEIGVDVTSDADTIADFLRKRGKGPKVIFTTYQSGEVVAEAARKANRILDVGIFDEAHRTVGQADSLFSHLLDESNIRIRKRIFMTATERRYQGSSDTILSMDDVDAYGETFDKMTFKEALEQKNPILSDYKIVTTVVGKSEIQHLIDENFLVKPDKGKWDDDTEARTLAALVALRKVMKKHKAKHALSFHNSISKAEAFKASQEKFNEAGKGFGKVDCFHVSSKVSTGERKAELEKFRHSENAIITNAKCLTEGVDVPTIDAVLFADTKRSTVDIVQAAGRALRRSEGKRRGYIIIPVLVDENDPEATDKAFQDILMTLRAMASNDDRIIDYFRSISQGKRPTKSDSIVDFEVPDPVKVHLEDFIESVETQVWNRLAKISWMPFEEARGFARSLNLKGESEWRAFRKTGQMPADIPSNPNATYKDKGWQGFGDWLGTGNIANTRKRYLEFEDARAFARSLGLTTRRDWLIFARSGKLPPNIPARPDHVYRESGWISTGDWLASGNVANALKKYRSFRKAREFVRKLNLHSVEEWKEFAKTDQKPSDIPANPSQTYKDKGWKGFGDWLGTGIAATFNREYRPFEEAREFVRRLRLKSRADWLLFTKTDEMPADIPATPERVYKNKGWDGIGNWLGTGTIASQMREYRPFEEAREFAQSLNLKSGAEWNAFTKTEHMPTDIPASPSQTYKDKGWQGMGDWLGTGNVAPSLKEYRPFSEAREFARSLNLKSRAEWNAFTKTEHMPADIPKNPNHRYKDEGWNGMGDWLGTGTIAPQMRKYRPFEEAQEFARSLKLKNQKEWYAFTKTEHMPADIPATPERVYKNKGWDGMKDWLGTS